MSNLLKEFLADGVADLVAMMGSLCVILDNLKNTATASFLAVVTSRDGSTEVEVGGITYTISGHALIPSNQSILPLVGNRLEVDNEAWLIVSVVKSATDAAYSCDLVRIK